MKTFWQSKNTSVHKQLSAYQSQAVRKSPQLQHCLPWPKQNGFTSSAEKSFTSPQMEYLQSWLFHERKLDVEPISQTLWQL